MFPLKVAETNDVGPSNDVLRNKDSASNLVSKNLAFCLNVALSNKCRLIKVYTIKPSILMEARL